MKSPLVRAFALPVFCSVLAATAFAQKSAPVTPSPTPRRALPKPVVARGFEQFATRDASARLIAGAATRVIVEPPGDHYSKGEALYKAGKYEEAAKELRIAVSQSPDWDDPHYVLGLTLTELGQLKEAIAEFQQAIRFAIKNDPKILAYYNIGNADADLGQFPDAIENYKQAITLDPTLSKPHNNLGLAYAALGRPREATAEFGEAARLKPDYAEAHYNLGVAYLQAGRRQDARKQQQILKKLDSELAGKLAALMTR
jgi:tetratricopeptide (TPR) repeat protein